jgi:hypothetical protein
VRKEIVLCPVEVIVTPKGTTVRMSSDFSGDEAFLDVARDLFHAEKMDDLSVVQVMDKHPGNLLHPPRVILYWEARWDKGVNAPDYPDPGWSKN